MDRNIFNTGDTESILCRLVGFKDEEAIVCFFINGEHFERIMRKSLLERSGIINEDQYFMYNITALPNGIKIELDFNFPEPDPEVLKIWEEFEELTKDVTRRFS